MEKLWFPVTPANTIVRWLGRETEEAAWAALLVDAAHMPYKGKEGFHKRGYRVISLPASLMVDKAPRGYKA